MDRAVSLNVTMFICIHRQEPALLLRQPFPFPLEST